MIFPIQEDVAATLADQFANTSMWELAGASDDDPEVTADSGKSGDWSTTINPASEFNVFAVALKGGNSFSLYYFEGKELPGSGTYNTDGLESVGNKNPQQPGLSHLTLYVGKGPDNSGVVPEPLTILGAGAAISFGTAFKRQLGKAKKNDKKA